MASDADNTAAGTAGAPLAAGAAPPALRLVFWETTAACNLACVHCRRLDVARQIGADDLATEQAADMVRSLRRLGRPILVFSGGEPLMRPDLLELARLARDTGVPAALATNGTIMTDELAAAIVESGVRRVSISFDGPNAGIHDRFRAIDGAFEASVRGWQLLRRRGMSMQMNTTVGRHNHRLLDDIYRLALDLGADALHVFMLVPVGCGMTLSPDAMLGPDEYEAALNWVYDRSIENRLHLKATCAPHYFRIMRQRAKADGRPMPPAAHTHRNMGPPDDRPGAGRSPHPNSGHSDMTAMTKGCLAGQSVCFISHTGEVYPCGYLPLSSGNVRDRPLPDIWRHSPIFRALRDDSHLAGKCGCCEFKRVCMGCRARAYAQTGDYLAEEPSCSYTPARLRG